MKNQLYPFKFESIYKEKIWGGSAIVKYKGDHSLLNDLGESWEVSQVKGSISPIANGSFKGETLETIVKQYGSALLGQHVYKQYDGEFPLLIKLIDANDTLSVQVHPDDTYAHEHHQSRGKTEMWYLLDTNPNAKIYANWIHKTNETQLRELVKTGEVMDYMGSYDAHSGDLFFLPAGTVHAIGAGCFVLEIQQASDVTYRLYDFNRIDDQGRSRELHIDDAVKVINYDASYQSRIDYPRDQINTLVSAIKCDYFETSYLYIDRPYQHAISTRDSFTYLFLIDGEVTIETNTCPIIMQRGESLLVPASITDCTIIPNREARLIDCYVP